jgi:hypothetical protein
MKNDRQKHAFDDVLRKMLDTAPSPHKPPIKKPAKKAGKKKKPA